MSEIYSNERFFKLTQGSIITNCVCSLGDDIDVWGFIITARCDCTNSKVDYVYYLPIVNFGDWFCKTKKQACYDKWLDQKRQTLFEKLNAVNKNNISNYDVFSRSEIESMLHDTKSKLRDEILSLHDELYIDNTKEFVNHVKTQTKFTIIKDDIKRITENNDNYYLIIPDWQPLRKDKHKIILLREIKRIKLCIAQAIEGQRYTIVDVEGFDADENDIKKTYPTNIYCIDKQMLSPYVEYVMQRFAHNFTRIGIDRLPTATPENLLKEIQESI